jgi:hypothetical protein
MSENFSSYNLSVNKKIKTEQIEHQSDYCG